MTPLNTRPKAPSAKKKERSLPVPLIVAAIAVLVIGIGVLIAGKAQRSDPTLTAAPPMTGKPEPVSQASPEKLAKQRQYQAAMEAQIKAFKAANH